MATARADRHVLTATTYSKSVLRVACEEILGRRTGIAYVPSYEIITGSYSRGRYFAADCREVNEAGVAHVMKVFFRHFATGDVDLRQPAPAPAAPDDAHQARIEELVAVNCDEIALIGAGRAAPALLRCNLCGGTDFGPGPNGRMAANGLGPRCEGCGSLERARAVANLFQILPPDLAGQWRALQVGRDQGVQPGWFRQSSACALSEALDYLHTQADGSVDLITLIFGFEFMPDDVAVFDQLVRLLSPSGIIQACFMDSRFRAATTPLPEPRLPRQPHRLYGLDLADHFGCWKKAVAVMEVNAVDPYTQAAQTAHFFARHESSLDIFRGRPSR
jgi:hypothetical protein